MIRRCREWSNPAHNVDVRIEAQVMHGAFEAIAKKCAQRLALPDTIEEMQREPDLSGREVCLKGPR